MVGSLCGKGYFINYQTGKASRKPLDLGNVVKGTMSLDPELMNLYVGQGVPRQPGPFGCQVSSSVLIPRLGEGGMPSIPMLLWSVVISSGVAKTAVYINMSAHRVRCAVSV